MERQDAALPGDRRFFERNGPFSLRALAECAGARVEGGDEADDAPRYVGIAPLQSAGPQEVSFLDNRRYAPLLEQTRAGVVILAPAFVDRLPKGTVGLVCSTPYLAWARVAGLFHPVPAAIPGIHPTAIVGAGADIDPSAQIGPFVTIGAGAQVGAGSRIDAYALIGDGVRIGAHCRIGSHASVSHALLGDRVTLLSGARIGQEGFGFAVGPDGFETVPQLGRVVLEDGVEVGANSTIDRGSSQDTVIGAGSRLDNLVQIGHNARLGRCCIVVSQAGISGSTELGDFVTIAAQAGLIGHIRVGTKARIGAQCGVMSDVEAGADVIGSPAMPFREFFRNVAVLRRLAKKATQNGGGET
ncbi:UDP-3-O-(3-hydroxymyristoyl) glucosamine N-acyltransferase [Gluconacetobacter diazotrophicus PA1 5]|uniref:UDP-3-O-acylglucosamine N-acyltransferase n=2 Tax=Gluconacetobacter diazotrophicus TaxID=33996 RepID=A9HKU5_GLUDA|nr:UDP-3-O-(3-hydroxymyristoyl)glucosamine N-acyltransferase [Gluconacetobacter diazotrophicus]ACI50159.1 UDP-3-O-(3-hydroxymyristoyl) glucosamine N-acyltransferase [Gluconacetobacter diazotrophicus PA1 5]MBB2154921.1 UDP-3-O-(3-hydroxymyristoyl)glucosamine N-acyltransferase [Gluconacetobacter diazotrophicus]TWB08085.1 UDP-3-O-[3-hydroxymyristoyl] glucosamine N-acyltransferase [Gluconacetobacter diazotrophicus]CAP56086.1 putative UDP-3-O-[3-hydroxymyristoyl] glucosamine N-acyltransferas [Glucon